MLRHQLSSSRTLLHIDCSSLGDASISRNLSHGFVKRWTEANPSGTVVRQDLNAGNIAPVDGTWVAGLFTPDTEFLTAGGTVALRYGNIDRDSFLKPYFDQIERSRDCTARGSSSSLAAAVEMQLDG
jgi:Flavodoxin-like fold